MTPEELARAHGYPAQIVRIVGELVRKRRADARIVRIGARDLEIEVIAGASVVMQHPSPRGYTCPQYESLSDSPRCRDYQSGGGCARPGQPVCVEVAKRTRAARGESE